MGGLGKSTAALAAARAASAAGWWVWWVNAGDAASLTGGMLELLGQLGGPDSVLRAVREGSPTGPGSSSTAVTGQAISGFWSWTMPITPRC